MSQISRYEMLVPFAVLFAVCVGSMYVRYNKLVAVLGRASAFEEPDFHSDNLRTLGNGQLTSRSTILADLRGP